MESRCAQSHAYKDDMRDMSDAFARGDLDDIDQVGAYRESAAVGEEVFDREYARFLRRHEGRIGQLQAVVVC